MNTPYYQKNKNPGQPAWEEAAPPEIIAAVNAIAKTNKLDSEARGKLLHHINGCPKCMGMMQPNRAK